MDIDDDDNQQQQHQNHQQERQHSVSVKRNQEHQQVNNSTAASKRIKLAPVMELIEQVGAGIMGGRQPGSGKKYEERWRSHFGASPLVCSDVWHRLDPTSLPAGSKVDHLLWALLLLKTYQTESVCCSLVGGVDEQTWRRWSWFFVDALSYLECDVVSTTVFW